MNDRNPLYYPDARYFSDCFLLSIREFGNFDKDDVAYICRHNEHGAFGFLLTKRFSLSGSAALLDLIRQQFDERPSHPWIDEPSFPRYVYLGGPMEKETATLLHPRDIYLDTVSTITFERGVSITANLAAGENYIMNDITAETSKMFLGHLSYGPGALNREIAQGLWKAYQANDHLLFRVDSQKIAGHLTKMRPVS